MKKKFGLGILIGLVVLVIGGIVIARGIERSPAIVLSSGIEVEVPDQAIDNSPVLVKAGEFVSDEIIVKFKGDKEPFRVLKVTEGKVKEKIAEFSKKVDVIYAEPNYIAYALWTPNDPYYSYQWHLDNPVYGGIGMEEAWELLGAPGTPGLGATVAVVDTGIRKGTDLANTCFVSGYDFVNNDSDPTDDNGHGTHVAGTVAQSTNNASGVAGVAFNSCLMPVKVLDKTGAGTYANIALGIRYGADNGAKVINLSLGGSATSTALEEAVAYASYEKGVTVIAAAGNENSTSILYPAAYNAYVIAVGATQYDETKAPYSNYGPSLDLVAPGGNTSLDQNNDGYADGILQQTFKIVGRTISWAYYFYQGTSMATPHVSGVAALLIAKGNATTPDNIRTALQTTAEYKVGRDDVYGGAGLVDAYAALGWTAGPECEPGQTRQCGETDLGVCEYGTQTCSAEGVWGECVGAVYPTSETCDGLDNDCDGWVDEELGQTACGVGACRVTVDNCVNGEPQVCVPGTPTDEVCDSVDNDCDGLVDEGGVCPSVKCWSGTNLYLYRTATADQARKFCKCAQGSYGYNSYKYNRSLKTVYKYVDTTDNTKWDVTSLSSYGPIYSVTCTDGKAYPTNLDYSYPK